MALDAVSNFVRGRADAELTAGATTLSVEDASIFPDPEEEGEYNLVIWDANNFPRPDQDSDAEIVRVTARDTDADELTVERGQETTSDVAHPEGSAVHLSPTAKMFTDIEDTFTTEAEAADAAPVQSVFGRVGDVVAETGDYAATQITNFGSEVLSSIDGSSISPSDITGLWDGSVVTADVDNQSVSTDQIFNKNSACRCVLSESQTISVDTIEQIQFDDTEFDINGDWDTTNHEWVCPENGLYQYAGVVELTPNEGDRLETFVQINGSIAAGSRSRKAADATTVSLPISQSTKELAEGDTITAHVRNSDSEDNIEPAAARTWFVIRRVA